MIFNVESIISFTLSFYRKKVLFSNNPLSHSPSVHNKIPLHCIEYWYLIRKGHRFEKFCRSRNTFSFLIHHNGSFTFISSYLCTAWKCLVNLWIETVGSRKQRCQHFSYFSKTLAIFPITLFFSVPNQRHAVVLEIIVQSDRISNKYG